MTLKTGRDRHLSNLTVPKAFEAAKLIRRKCADFRQGAGYILVTHTPFQRPNRAANGSSLTRFSIYSLAPRGAVHIWAQHRVLKSGTSPSEGPIGPRDFLNDLTVNW